MHARRFGLIALLTLASLAGSARADSAPPANEWPVERNAQQLHAAEWKLGLFGVDVGVHERLQLGTLWPTWVLLGPNLHAKALLVARHGFQFSAEASAFYLNLAHLRWYGLDDVTGHFIAVPVELFLDKQVTPRLLLGLGAGYSVIHTSPRYDPKSFSGAAAYDSLLLRGHLTGRVGPKVWIVVELDWVLHQLGAAAGSIDTQLTDYIHARGRATAIGKPIEPARGGAITTSIVVRARHFGFRFGIGFGNFVMPRVKLVVPLAIPFFTLDIYTRFGGRRASSEDAREPLR